MDLNPLGRIAYVALLFSVGLAHAGPPYPLTRIRTRHPAVEDLISRWAAYDGCPPEPGIASTLHDSGGSAGHTATRRFGGSCPVITATSSGRCPIDPQAPQLSP